MDFFVCSVCLAWLGGLVGGMERYMNIKSRERTSSERSACVCVYTKKKISKKIPKIVLAWRFRLFCGGDHRFG